MKTAQSAPYTPSQCRADLSKYRAIALRLLAFFLMAAGIASADTLQQVTTAAAQGATDSLPWSQKGADGVVLAASFTATTKLASAVTVNLAAPNSVISTVCAAATCSWTGIGFTAGHSLLWTSDAGNGGSAPVTLTFTKGVAGAGALIQADIPGAFTAQIQFFNGATALGAYSVASNTNGDPVYLGAIDQSGANITKVVFSLTACKSLCSDFGLDTVAVNPASATSPTVTLTPATLTFPTTVTGTTSDAQVLTLTNTGTVSVSLTSITLGGTNPTSFFDLSSCGTTLASKASCSIIVAFKPATAAALTATLSVTDNATGSPQKVTLTGTGTALPTVKLSATTLAFATTKVATTTAAKTITITNSGKSTVNLASISLTGTNPTSFIQLNNCPATLAPAATCTAYIAFKPTAVGALKATLSISDNAAASPQIVALTGTGN